MPTDLKSGEFPPEVTCEAEGHDYSVIEGEYHRFGPSAVTCLRCERIWKTEYGQAESVVVVAAVNCALDGSHQLSRSTIREMESLRERLLKRNGEQT
jgi:hypothetical protein